MFGNYESYMLMALDEAKSSLKEGNHGFGAVIVKGGTILAKTHDREVTESDPTSHAELNAIRLASQKLGRNLSGCLLIATHEPCPMCATALIWSGITTLVFGYSIREAMAEGRERINLTCRELFARAEADIDVQEGILHDQCALLYHKQVREEIKKLRGAKSEDLHALQKQLAAKRVSWYERNRGELQPAHEDLVGQGYELLLKKMDINPIEAPIVTKTADKVVFHSQNFCPTLEACKILDLDTRVICREVNEKATDALVKQLSERLEFRRNYEKLRPYCDYCEEMVFIEDSPEEVRKI